METMSFVESHATGVMELPVDTETHSFSVEGGSVVVEGIGDVDWIREGGVAYLVSIPGGVNYFYREGESDQLWDGFCIVQKGALYLHRPFRSGRTIKGPSLSTSSGELKLSGKAGNWIKIDIESLQTLDTVLLNLKAASQGAFEENIESLKSWVMAVYAELSKAVETPREP
jgi:hypothetical protein